MSTVLIHPIARDLRGKYPDAFDDGVRSGLGLPVKAPREPGGYPLHFHQWPLEKRNAWFAGYNRGHVEREAAR